MILLVTDKEGRDLSKVTRIEDVSREGSSITRLELFSGDESLGKMEVENKMRIEILPNIT